MPASTSASSQSCSLPTCIVKRPLAIESVKVGGALSSQSPPPLSSGYWFQSSCIVPVHEHLYVSWRPENSPSRWHQLDVPLELPDQAPMLNRMYPLPQPVEGWIVSVSTPVCVV